MTKYIPLEPLVAEIEKRRDAALMRQQNLESIGQETVINKMIAYELNRIISFIGTLEVKEVQDMPLSEDFKQFENAYLEKEKDEIICVYDRHAGLVDGAQWQKQQIRKEINLLKEWFEDISEKCEHLTSGNVSHNGKMIRGFAKNCAEYIETDLL